MATADMTTTTSVATPELAGGPKHPLRERNFLLLFAGSTVSLLGDQFYFIALPWLVLQQTGSAIAMGTIMMTGAIPRAVLMLMGGAVSDRISPRKVMMLGAGGRAVLVLAIAVMMWLHLLHTWELYALAAAFGTADAFDGPAGLAFLPFLVQPEQLVAATSVSEVRSQLASIIGPAPAGIILKILGVAWVFLIDAISFLFIIAALLLLPDPPPSQNPKKPLLQSILEGLRYVKQDVPLRSLLTVAVGINFCLAGPVMLGLAYLAKTKFDSAAMFGVMLTCLAAGALCGSLLAGIWKIHHRGLLIILVALVLGLSLGSLGMLGGRWAFPGILLLMGCAAGLVNVHIGSWIMQRIDPDLRGRVSSVLSLGARGTLPISLALAGLLIAVSLKLMFLLAGAMLLLVTIAAATQKTVREID